jgi:4-methyl-5(b-hydroxyethyl)-thiazole monophosphate biosynthesis
MSKKILVPLATGFEEIEAVTIIDVLTRAGVNVLTASLDDNKNVKGANGIVVVANYTITQIDVDSLDMIVLPGGWDGTHALTDDENIQSILKKMNEDQKHIGAICAAPFALKQADVLSSNYTCYPSVEEQIKQDGYTDQSKVVQDGKIITSRGPATAICFALHIVKNLVSEQKYQELKGGLLADFC